MIIVEKFRRVYQAMSNLAHGDLPLGTPAEQAASNECLNLAADILAMKELECVLRSALSNMAAIADSLPERVVDDDIVVSFSGVNLHAGHFRDAREALQRLDGTYTPTDSELTVYGLDAWEEHHAGIVD